MCKVEDALMQSKILPRKYHVSILNTVIILAKGYFASIHTDLEYYLSTFSTVKILSKYGTILSKQSMVIILRILPGYFHSTPQAILQ
jgi:hypothetical protein